MATRRDFLKTTAAVAAPAILAGSPLMANVVGRPVRFGMVLFDRRFPDSARFGGIVAARGATTHDVQGDLTPLWYDTLQPMWRERPVPVAGLTNHRALICLEGFARDHGLRVAYRAEHRAGNANSVDHRIEAGDSAVAATRAALRSGQPWSAAMADVITGYRDDRTPPVEAAVTSAAGGLDKGSLFSWVIVPIRAA